MQRGACVLAACAVFVSSTPARAQKVAPTPVLDPTPDPPGSLVTLSFEDADLQEIVHSMSVMTGRRFVVAATPKSFRANVIASQKVTVSEAYQALLAVLAQNHLTVIPAGPFWKIVEASDATHEAPVGAPGADVPAEERFITYVHRVRHVRADDVVTNVLSKLASRDGSVLAFGTAILVTDTGTNVRRMMKVLEQLDIAGVEDKVWLEPLKYAIAADVKKEVDELIELKETKDKDPRKEIPGLPRITRLVALERPNAILVVGTPEGYERLLELLRQIDVPQPVGGQMHVVMLEHAEAKKLVTALMDAVTAATTAPQGGKEAKQPLGIFDSPVKVSAEETNNALIVTASPHDFAAVSDVIRRLDQPRRQVYIEGVVMDLSVDNTTQVGMALHGFGDLSGSLGPGAVAYGGFNPMQSLALPTDPTALQGLVLGLRGPSIPVPGFLQSVIGTSTIPGMGFLIDASTVSADSNIVQSPSVMTTDNTPAEFHMQLNTSLQTNAPSIALPPVPAAAGAAASPAAAAPYLPYSAPAQQNYGKIGPMLQVTPHLNESDDVRLDIEETISDLTPQPPQGTLGTVSFIERGTRRTMRGRSARRAPRSIPSTASPSASPPCASTYSTQAHLTRARARARRRAPEAAAQPLEPRVDDVDPRERRAVERRVALRAEGRDAERDGDDLRQLRRERAHSSMSSSVSPGSADHQVELQPVHAVLLRELGALRGASGAPDGRATRGRARSCRPSRS
jgi:general secretion pathway protein D